MSELGNMSDTFFTAAASGFHQMCIRDSLKTVRRLPRPMSHQQVDALLGALRNLRDRSLVLLMLNAGLRPGETLGLHLDDIAYGRRRVFIRCRDDHPKGARSKSRVERVVDLHDGTTLDTLNAYVMGERPPDAASPFIFLIGGNSGSREEPCLLYTSRCV